MVRRTEITYKARLREISWLKATKSNKSRLKEIRQGTGLTIDQVVEATGISNNLFYYTMANEVSNRLYEIDFLMSVGDKISPIEVKSGNYRSHKSLDIFCDKFSSRIKDKYVIHTKDYKWENRINYISVYRN